MLTIVFSFLYGLYAALGATVGLLTDKFGYSPEDNSIFGGVFIGSGVLASFGHAVFLDKYQRHKVHLIVVTSGSVLASLLVLFLIDT